MRWRLGAAFAVLTVVSLVGAGWWWLTMIASGGATPPSTEAIAMQAAAGVSTEEAEGEGDGAPPQVNTVHWLLLEGARNSADAAAAAASAAAARDKYCGADFPHAFGAGAGMDDPRNAQLAAHEKTVLAEQSRQLSLSGDELARMTAALLQFDVGQVTNIAEQTADPLVYGLALRLCRKVDMPACRSLTPARWLQLDPSNAAALWQLAAEAPTLAETRHWLGRAHEATHATVLKGRLLKRVVDSGVSDPRLLLPIANRTMGMDAAESADFFHAASRVCGRAAPADAALRSVCQGYAKDAIRLQTSIEDRGLAGVFADRMLLPTDGLAVTPAQLVETMRRYTVMRAGRASPEEGLSCARTQYSVALDVEAATTGDLATFLRRGGQLPTPEEAEASMPRKRAPLTAGL